MQKIKWRVIAVSTTCVIVGVFVYMLIVNRQPAIEDEAPGNQAVATTQSGDIEIRVTTASLDHPVRIDTFEHSAEIHLGDDIVRVYNQRVTLPGGEYVDIPDTFKSMVLKQSKHGIRVWLDDTEVFPRISKSAKAVKAEDLHTFDQLRDDLENADQFELLSLDPVNDPIVMLGKTEIKDRGVRKKLLDAFRVGIVNFEHDSIANCYDPRHEIRAIRDGKALGLTICFECNRVYASGDKKFQISDTPQPVFDQVLRDAGVPLPKPGCKKK